VNRPDIYVPFLRAKEGELSALKLLHDFGDKLLPLLEVPPIQYDFANETYSRDLSEHLENVLNRIVQCWASKPCLLYLPGAVAAQGNSNLEAGYKRLVELCESNSLSATIVVDLDLSARSRRTLKAHISRDGRGAALRLRTSDFDDEQLNLATEVERLLRDLGVSEGDLDVLVDMESIAEFHSPQVLLMARAALAAVPRVKEVRRLVLASSAFPAHLGALESQAASKVERKDWKAWIALTARPERLPDRVPIFADYAISHPDPPEIDPRIMKMSANIRYTTEDSWLVLKGQNVRDYGFEQFRELSRTLIQREEYSGKNFSDGDKFISDCAEGIVGTGNATTWRRVATNHHVTLVARRLANLNAAS
jgi:hypothetical protein